MVSILRRVSTKTGSPQQVSWEHELEPAGSHYALSIWVWIVKGFRWKHYYVGHMLQNQDKLCPNGRSIPNVLVGILLI